MAPGVEAVVVAECLKRTLEPNAQIRRIAENDLKQMEQLPGKLLIYVRIDNMGIAIDNFTWINDYNFLCYSSISSIFQLASFQNKLHR